MTTTTSNPSTTTEYAAAIRATLKAKGWNARKVSVRAHLYSMGSSIYVTIKDATVPFAEVEAIAQKAERIDRCSYSGEILSGGNRYVDVSYDSDVLTAMASVWMPAVEEALSHIKPEGEQDSYLYDIAGTDMMVGRSNNGYGFSVWQKDTATRSGSHLQACHEAASVARTVAVRMAGR